VRRRLTRALRISRRGEPQRLFGPTQRSTKEERGGWPGGCARRRARAKLCAAQRFEESTDRAGKLARQIRQRVGGENITDRLV